MPYKSVEAQRAYQRMWACKQRQGNTVYNLKRRRWNKAHAQRWADWLMSIKRGLACRYCGENHPACIDFHHRDPATKLFEICSAARAQVSKSKILAEIKKCDPVCANCHRKLHWDERHGSADQAG